MEKLLQACGLEPWARRVLHDLSEAHTAMGKVHETVSPLIPYHPTRCLGTSLQASAQDSMDRGK